MEEINAEAVVGCRYKGSRELQDSDKYSMSKDGDTYVLVVSDVFGEDADEYCVKATTPAGSRASRADLVIKSQSLLTTFRLRSHRHECEYESESGCPSVTRTNFTRTSGAFALTCTST